MGNFEDQLGRIKQIVKREEKAKADIQARIRQAQAVLDQPVEDMAAQQTELQQSRVSDSVYCGVIGGAADQTRKLSGRRCSRPRRILRMSGADMGRCRTRCRRG